jgi:lactate dehydrogenase-like 2-hydroxyacid dehydrogenase
MVVTQGVGFENVDIETVKDLGLVLTTGKGTNAFSVADHAMALLLASARHIVWADRRVREGKWLDSRGPRAIAWRKKLGIMGLGEIGMMIANRAKGFEMEVSYHNRNRRDDTALTYCESPLELARNNDFLLIAMPGGVGTKGLIDAEVLDALGPKGYLINIGRGTIVDTDALIAALHEGRIAGAALDVVAGEPEVSDALLGAPNLTLTPHMASRSPESVNEAMNRIANNLKAHFAGDPLVSRIF